MSSLKERLDAAIKQGKAKPSELARACGISEAAVSKWRSGATVELKSAHLFIVARTCGVDPEWLATGHGKMEKAGQDRIPDHRIRLIKQYGTLPKVVREPIRALIETLALAHSQSYLEWSLKLQELVRERDAKAASKPKTTR